VQRVALDEPQFRVLPHRRARPVGQRAAHGRGRLERDEEPHQATAPGDRAMIRERTTTVVMHLLRRLLA